MNEIIKILANIAINNKKVKIATLNNPFNADFLHLIEYHQLLPFIHYFKQTLKNPVTTINEHILIKSQEQYLQNICNYLRCVDFLRQNKPPFFILVKGPVSAKYFYEDVGFRTFNDLDIIIQHEDFSRWNTFLKKNNFHKFGNVSDPFPEEVVLKYNFAQHFINDKQKIAIDLHLNISNIMHPFQFDKKDFFNHIQKINIEGIPTLTFQPEYLITYLLYHTFKHYHFKMIWFIDLYKALKFLNYNENSLLHLIQKYHLGNLLDYYISIANEIFGDCGINTNSVLIKDHRLRIDKYFNSDQILAGELKTTNSFNRLILPMYLIPNLSMKIKYLFTQFFPPRVILPEFYNKGNNFNYFMNRMNRFTRLFHIEEA